MARAVEVVIVQAAAGKTRAQQIARLKEWKKHWLGLGAEKVVVHEITVGNIDGGWLFSVHHKSGAAFGAGWDAYLKNSKGFDSAVEKWMKAPMFSIVNYALTFESDEI